MRKTILIVSLLLFIFGCQKQAETDVVPFIEIKLNIHHWLRGNQNGFDDTTALQFEAQLLFEQSWTEPFRNSETLLIVPLNGNYKTANHVLQKTSILAVFVVGSNKLIRLGNIVELISNKESSATTVGLISCIYENRPHSYEGIVSVMTMRNKIVFELEYNQKTLIRYSYPTTKNKNHKNGKLEGCTDWYWVTTYYNSDGSYYQKWDFLYRTCDGECNIERILNKEQRNFKINCGGNSGQAYEEIPLVSVYDVIDSLVNKCLKNAKNKVTDARIKNTITDLYQQFYIGLGNEVNLKFVEKPNQATPASSIVDKATNTWVIFLDSTKLSNSSEEFIGGVILHELIHSFIFLNPDYKPDVTFNDALVHPIILTQYTAIIRDALIGTFGISGPDATSLALSGVENILIDYNKNSVVANWDKFCQKNFNISTSSAYDIYWDYFTGIKGVKCK